MEKREIKDRIKSVYLQPREMYDSLTDELVDLFIELSNERCKDQIRLCYKTAKEGYDILDSPFPMILTDHLVD